SAAPPGRINVLAQGETITPSISLLSSEQVKAIGRFWFGTKKANQLRKAECEAAILSVFADPAKVRDGIDTLPANEKQILGIFERYGGGMSGALLLCDALGRGLIDAKPPQPVYYRKPKSEDAVSSLCNKFLLVTKHGLAHGGY